jgi:hypothetical protein
MPQFGVGLDPSGKCRSTAETDDRMEATRSSYPYQPLNEPLLLPNQDYDADLHGSLVHTTLDECDEDLVDSYAALSYVLGDATQTATIYLAGHAVIITVTFGAALQDMRDETRTAPNLGRCRSVSTSPTSRSAMHR